MAKDDAQAREAAKLLGRRGGLATLKKYGKQKMRDWGCKGREYGRLGGRPSYKGGRK